MYQPAAVSVSDCSYEVVILHRMLVMEKSPRCIKAIVNTSSFRQIGNVSDICSVRINAKDRARSDIEMSTTDPFKECTT